MKHMKYVGLVVLVMAILVSPVAAFADTSKEGTPIKIGAFLDYTGPNVGIGQQHEMGIKLRLEEAGWAFNDRKIELIIEDTAGDPTICADKVKKFVEVDKVDVILGPLMENCAAPVLTYTERSQLPNIALMSHELGLVRKHSHMFAPLGGMTRYAYALGRYTAETLDHKRASVLGPDFVAGHKIALGFKTGFEKYGGSVIKEQFYPFGTLDWSPYLLALKDADVLHTFFLTPVDALRAIDQHRQYGINVPIIHAYAEIFDAVMKKHGKDLLGVVGQVTYNWTLDTEINKQFVSSFERKYGEKPTSFHANGYTAVSLFLEALKLREGDTTPEKLTQTMQGLSMDSPLGHFALTSEGVGVMPRYIVQGAELGDTYTWKVIKVYPAAEE